MAFENTLLTTLNALDAEESNRDLARYREIVTGNELSAVIEMRGIMGRLGISKVDLQKDLSDMEKIANSQRQADCGACAQQATNAYIWGVQNTNPRLFSLQHSEVDADARARWEVEARASDMRFAAAMGREQQKSKIANLESQLAELKAKNV